VVCKFRIGVQYKPGWSKGTRKFIRYTMGDTAHDGCYTVM